MRDKRCLKLWSCVENCEQVTNSVRREFPPQIGVYSRGGGNELLAAQPKGIGIPSGPKFYLNDTLPIKSDQARCDLEVARKGTTHVYLYLHCTRSHTQIAKNTSYRISFFFFIRSTMHYAAFERAFAHQSFLMEVPWFSTQTLVARLQQGLVHDPMMKPSPTSSSLA